MENYDITWKQLFLRVFAMVAAIIILSLLNGDIDITIFVK